MMEYEIIDNRIFYFKNAIPNYKNIINFISNNNNKFISEWLEWKEFKERGGRNYGFSKEIHGCVADNSEAGNYIKEILDGINSACEVYKKEKQIDHLRKWPTDFTILRYHEFEDQDGRIMPGGQLNAHLDHPDPNFLEEHTILVYYNDDYSGGDLFFNELNLKIKPKAGSIIMFQSVDPLTIHSTVPIEKGIKYFTFQLWIDGPGKGWRDKNNPIHPGEPMLKRMYNTYMSETSAINCCASCICEDFHSSIPIASPEEDVYAQEPKYITEDILSCCDLCICENPHRSKPID